MKVIRESDRVILRLFKFGVSITNLAAAFEVSVKTIEEIIRREMQK